MPLAKKVSVSYPSNGCMEKYETRYKQVNQLLANWSKIISEMYAQQGIADMTKAVSL